MKLLNMRKKKNKGTTKYDKSRDTCDVSIAQCDNKTIKCNVLVNWYKMLPICGYHAPKKRGYYRITYVDVFSPFFPFTGLIWLPCVKLLP